MLIFLVNMIDLKSTKLRPKLLRTPVREFLDQIF